MPYPNEHSCRHRDPDDFQAASFRRIGREHEGKPYAVIMGRLKGESTMTEQAFRYPIGSWTEAAARAHCKEHDGILFEAATTKRLRYMSTEEVVLDAAAPASIEAGPALCRVNVLRAGTFHHPVYGRFDLTAATFKTMAANFREGHPAPPTEMVVDYEHASIEATQPEEGQAAGWVKALEAEDDKLFALVEWTAAAAQYIRDKRYRFISADFILNYKHKETGKLIGPCLVSVALTNRPWMEGLEPVTLRALLTEDGAYYLDGLVDPTLARRVPETTATKVGMEYQEQEPKEQEDSKLTGEQLKQLRAVLGIGEGEDVIEAARRLKAEHGQYKAARGEAETLRQQLRERDRDIAVREAITAGKVTPAQAEAWANDYALKDPEGFVKYLKTAQRVAPLEGERGSGGEGDNVVLTEQERIIAKMLGVDEKTLRETKAMERS